MHFCLRARAREVTDPEDRRAIMSAPATRWYRERSDSFEALVAWGPIVEVTFPEQW